jgi:HlyD family secretion protein
LGDGFRVEARIVVAEADDVLKIPASALFRVGEDWAVFREVDGRARQSLVTVGLENGLEAEIKEGLVIEDRVLLHPGDEVAEGALVRQRNGGSVAD